MPDAASCNPRALLPAWTRVGVQSFGGGAATLALIRREFVDRNAWLSEEQFTRDWSLCQLAPGINLIAFAYLIGKRLGGKTGIAVSLFGLLAPSFLLTLLVTYAYVHFKSTEQAHSALRLLVPAVAGIGLATAFQMARPIAKAELTKGLPAAAFWILLFAAAVTAFNFAHPPAVAVLLAAGAIGAARGAILAARRREAP